nr:MAG TPA: hypothetical protein [Crassvirales sp.]
MKLLAIGQQGASKICSVQPERLNRGATRDSRCDSPNSMVT